MLSYSTSKNLLKDKNLIPLITIKINMSIAVIETFSNRWVPKSCIIPPPSPMITGDNDERDNVTNPIEDNFSFNNANMTTKKNEIKQKKLER